jgi:tRNA-specific 2-thiouridylase
VDVKIRYRSRPVPASIEPAGKSWRVSFAEPQPAVAPGQSAVFYRGDEVLGGGVIREAVR